MSGGSYNYLYSEQLHELDGYLRRLKRMVIDTRGSSDQHDELDAKISDYRKRLGLDQ